MMSTSRRRGDVPTPRGDGGTASARSSGRGQARDRPPKTAPELDREAKSIAGELQTALGAQAPWTKEIETLRQRCRATHLVILFNHPHSTFALSLDHLWVNTSYLLISSFRDHLARARQAANEGAPSGPSRHHRPSAAAENIRKISTRFRQFLSSEEAWYRQLVLRLVKAFCLHEWVAEGLEQVGMSVSDRAEATMDGSSGTAAEKDKVALVYKAMICLGDVERYKAQNPASSSPVASTIANVDYTRSMGYYDAARNIIPTDGSAFNQLAVISSYTTDDFSTLYYYIRAAAVQVPFKGAEDILQRFLNKTARKLRATGDESWKNDVVGAVVDIYLGRELEAGVEEAVASHIGSLLAQRRLPSEGIVKMTCIVLGLQWRCRMRGIAEAAGLSLTLSILRTVFAVATAETDSILANPSFTSAIADDDDPSSSAFAHFTRNITSTLRRLLPPIRIMSKWLKLNLDYLSRVATDVSGGLNLSLEIEQVWKAYYRLIEGLARAFPLQEMPGCEGSLEEGRDMRGFVPVGRGFSHARPATVQMGNGSAAHNAKGRESARPSPNEEQLMRISDIEVDATLILQSQAGLAQISAQLPPDPDETASVSTATEDDPVNLAMRATLNPESETDNADSQLGDSIGDLSLRPHTLRARPSNGGYVAQDVTPVTRPAPLPSTNAHTGSAYLGGEGIWSMNRESNRSGSGGGRQREALAVGVANGRGTGNGVNLSTSKGSTEDKVRALWGSPVSEQTGYGQYAQYQGMGGLGGWGLPSAGSGSFSRNSMSALPGSVPNGQPQATAGDYNPWNGTAPQTPANLGVPSSTTSSETVGQRHATTVAGGSGMTAAQLFANISNSASPAIQYNAVPAPAPSSPFQYTPLSSQFNNQTTVHASTPPTSLIPPPAQPRQPTSSPGVPNLPPGFGVSGTPSPAIGTGRMGQQGPGQGNVKVTRQPMGPSGAGGWGSLAHVPSGHESPR